MVILDDVQYTKNHVYNRNRIMNEMWLTIPVVNKSNVKFKEVLVSDQNNWKRKHINSLRSYSKREPNFYLIDKFCDYVYSLDSSLLIDYTMNSILFLMNHFNITTKLVMCSTLFLGEKKGTDMILEIVNSLEGDTYLSGKGAVTETKNGPAYLDVSKFSDVGLEILDYIPPNNLSSLHNAIVGFEFET